MQHAIHAFLTAEGADLVGFADLSVIPEESRQGLPRGVVFAMMLDPRIAETLPTGPTREYAEEYDRLNATLGALGERCAVMLRERGYRAVNQGTTVAALDLATLAVPLPHKTVATRAGLGWVGKCALLITPEFGSAIRINTVLTDAPFATGTPIETSGCPAECGACREVCPGSAPTGALWHAGLARQEFYDAFACFRAARSLSRAAGIPHTICGRCIAACPFTREWLQRHGV